MRLTHYELDCIVTGLVLQEKRMLDDYHAYRNLDNQPAADDCLAQYKFLRDLEHRLRENKRDDGTEFAYTIS